MDKSFSLFKVAGIDVRVNATLFLLAAYWGYSGYQAGGEAGAKFSVFFLMLLFVCVLLHEFGHAGAGAYYGIRTRTITLSWLGGLAQLESIPRKPIQEIVITIAGPMVNVVIAVAAWLVMGMPTHSFRYYGDDNVRLVASLLMRVNMLLFFFNLIPAFPMDGGRLLRASLATRLDHATATQIATRVGQAAAICLALIGFFGIPAEASSIPVLGIFTNMFGSGQNYILIFIAISVFMGAQQEFAFTRLRTTIENLRVSDATLVNVRFLYANSTITDAAREAGPWTQMEIPVVESDARPIGIVPRHELLSAPGRVDDRPVRAVTHAVPSVGADASVTEAVERMRESGSSVLPVVDAEGRLAGLVSLNLLNERVRRPAPRS